MALRAGAPPALYAALHEPLHAGGEPLVPAALDAFDLDGGPVRGGRRSQAFLTAVAAHELRGRLDRESWTAALLNSLVFLQQAWPERPVSGQEEGLEAAWTGLEGWGEAVLVAAARKRLAGGPAPPPNGPAPNGEWTEILERAGQPAEAAEPLGGLLRAACVLAAERPKWRELRTVLLARAALASPSLAAEPLASFLSETWRRSGLSGERSETTPSEQGLLARATRLDARSSFGLVLQLAEAAGIVDEALPATSASWGTAVFAASAPAWSRSRRHWTQFTSSNEG